MDIKLQTVCLTIFGVSIVAGATMLLLAVADNSNRWVENCHKAGKSIIGHNCVEIGNG